MIYQLFVIEDQPAIRAVYRHYIARESNLQIVGEAMTGKEALRLLQEHKPDIILLDLSLPDTSGLELLKILKQLYPQIPVLVVSGQDETIYGPLALKAGASGYVEKSHVIGVLPQAISKIVSGLHHWSSGVIDRANGQGTQGKLPQSR
ncbi:MAG: response regulator transcription factor [Caldilineaceae bacterium]